MIFRILMVVGVFVLMYFLATMVISFLNRNICRNCDGQGYWTGVRGEKNDCKVCNGKGRVS